MAARIDREELRLLIRQALKEALGESPPPPRSGLPDLGATETKSGKPDFGRGRVREGRQPPAQHRSPSPSTSAQRGGGGAFSFNVGVLTEAKVAELGKAHGKILVGSEVVVTPLARDRARAIKVAIERQKP